MLKWNLGLVMGKNEPMENSGKMIDIKEMAAIFQFFIMANTDILFPLTTRKLET